MKLNDVDNWGVAAYAKEGTEIIANVLPSLIDRVKANSPPMPVHYFQFEAATTSLVVLNSLREQKRAIGGR